MHPIFMNLLRRVSRDGISLLAAAIAFWAFAAVPSALTAIVSLYGLMFGPLDIAQQLGYMNNVLPADVISLLSDFLTSLSQRPTTQLGLGLGLGFGLAIWSAQSATYAMITALGVIHGAPNARGVVRVQALALAMASAAIGFAVFAAALLDAVPAVFDFFKLGEGTKTLAGLLRWPILLVLVGGALAGIYRFAPARPGLQRASDWWGVLLATASCLIGSVIFSLYVADIATYDKSYGSLGGVLVLMLWLYLTAFFVLLGAELNAVLAERLHDRRGGKPHA